MGGFNVSIAVKMIGSWSVINTSGQKLLLCPVIEAILDIV